jgi:hypothetical protein
MNTKVFVLTLLFLGLSSYSFALEFGCEFVPTMAAKLVDKTIRNAYKKQQLSTDGSISVPNLIPLQNTVEQDFNFDGAPENERTRYEAILRPKQSDFIQVLHLVMFRLERTRHLLYVCFNHNNLTPEQNHVTIYFLAAYGLEPLGYDRDNYSTGFFDWLLGPGSIFKNEASTFTSITRIPIELVPIHYVTNGMRDFTEDLPIIGKILKAPSTAMQIPGNLLNGINNILRAGVERIVITSDKIEFASSVDLDHPENARILYEMDLNGQK